LSIFIKLIKEIKTMSEKKKTTIKIMSLKEITLCNLEVIVMPNGEVICRGKTIGWSKDLKKYLTVKNLK